MNTLKTISLIIILIGLGFGVANAGHQRDNGTCNDDIFHYNNMESKRTDALVAPIRTLPLVSITILVAPACIKVN